ncbi:hypothetical protein [Actinomadura chokoriensis]|uniref:Uncharacterized protein n=1 Tax=Actinomadura chokoriensis TaxID=454156 RepID=A0ABV4R959_9ACTN
MTTPAQEAQQRQHAEARLAALAANLNVRGVLTRIDADNLAILNDGGQQADTIFCRPWPLDRDAWWFFDCAGEPLAEAGDIVGAAVAILGNLQSGTHG